MNVDAAALAQRFTDYALEASSLGVLARNGDPSVLSSERARFLALGANSVQNAMDFAALTGNQFPEMNSQLADAVRGAVALTNQVGAIVSSRGGSVPSAVLNNVMDQGPRTAKQAAALLSETPTSGGQIVTRNLSTSTFDGPMVRMDEVAGKVMQRLAQADNNSVIVKGLPGSGRSLVHEALAAEIAAGRAPESLAGRQVLEVSHELLRGDTGKVEDVAKRFKDILKQASISDKHVLVIDDFENLDDGFGASTLIRNALDAPGSKLRVVLLTTPEHAAKVEGEFRLGRHTHTVDMPKSDIARSEQVLAANWPRLEAHHGVTPENGNVTTATVGLAKNYLLGKSGKDLAGLAVDVADGAAAKLTTEIFTKPKAILADEGKIADLERKLGELEGRTSPLAETRRERFAGELAEARDRLGANTAQWELERPLVTERVALDREIRKLASAKVGTDDPRLVQARSARASVQERLDAVRAGKEPVINDALDEAAISRFVAETTGVPVETLAWDNVAKFREMDKRVGARVVGQPGMVDVLSDAVKIWKAGNKPENKPVGIFFFGGPSGVGKTEVVNVVADDLYGSREALGAIPGSMYEGKDGVNTLFSPKAGYEGASAGGLVPNHLRDHPNGITLLDEADKLYPDAFTYLLEVGDYGRLTDGAGRANDAKNHIFVHNGNWMKEEINMLARDWDTMSQPQRDQFTALYKDWIDLEGITPKELKDRLRGPIEGLSKHDQKMLEDMFRTALKRQGIRSEVLNRAKLQLANPVSESMLQGVADLNIKSRTKEMAANGVELVVDKPVVDWLVRNNLDPDKGGRYVQLGISESVVDAISTRKVNGEILRGDRVTAKLVDDQIALDIEHQ